MRVPHVSRFSRRGIPRKYEVNRLPSRPTTHVTWWRSIRHPLLFSLTYPLIPDSTCQDCFFKRDGTGGTNKLKLITSYSSITRANFFFFKDHAKTFSSN